MCNAFEAKVEVKSSWKNRSKRRSRSLLGGFLASVSSLMLFSDRFAWAQETEIRFQDGAPEIKITKAEQPAMPRLTDLARDLSSTVVNISVEGGAVPEGAEEAVDGGKRRESPLRSLGSGFIVSSAGYIVTSNHVIDKADRVVVRVLDDKRDYVAKVVGRDQKTDIALLKIDPPQNLHAVFLGDSDQLEVGEWVMAIGNQFQLGQTVTAGIVSAKSRRVPSGAGNPYDAFIQTDASINPGSSGGPLFNTRGQVVGINTAIFSPGRSQFGGTGFNIGIGFAIPINLARRVIEQLSQHGKVTRGLLGVLIQRVDADISQVLKLAIPDGALVSDVMRDSPAAQAGFKRRDVIVKFNNLPVRDHDDLPLMVANTTIGSKVPVEVMRDGKLMELSVTIAELKDDGGQRLKIPEEVPNEIGLVVEGVSEEFAKSLGLSEPSGVLVAAVAPDSAAERAGIARGDLIEEFAHQSIKGVKDFRDIVAVAVKKAIAGGNDPQNVDPGDDPSKTRLLVLIRRKEGVRYLTLKLEDGKKLP
jgi:serine protease Do